jgi:transcription termination/antitermination protein NusA
MSEITSAIRQICDEKGLSYEAVITTIESALAAAYRKDFGQKNQNIQVEYDPETTKTKIFDVKTVVEDLPEIEEVDEEEAVDSKDKKEKVKKEKKKDSKKDKKKGDKEEKKENKKGDKEDIVEEKKEEERKFNPKTDLQISDAKLVKKTAKIDDVIKSKLDIPEGYGRMAAQTAKQVIIQRLREAERDMVFNDFKDKEHEVVSGVVQRREGRIVLVDLDRAVGVIPADEQIYGEKYNPGDRVKVYVKEVSLKARGPEIILSRTSDEILRKIFYLEIPEISNGLIELKAVAREAGSRSKVGVSTETENVDPIGSCVGQRGARIQTIISELGGEKVDIIEYDENPEKFIINALAPAKVLSIETEEEDKSAKVLVQSDQLSLAIGKGGQNARLAARLTGWKIDIVEAKDESSKKGGDEKDEKNDVETETETEVEAEDADKATEETTEKKTKSKKDK